VLKKSNGFNIEGHGWLCSHKGKIPIPGFFRRFISFVVEKGEVPLFIILDGINGYKEYWLLLAKVLLTVAGFMRSLFLIKGIGALNEDCDLATSPVSFGKYLLSAGLQV
jgi:23S rRNA (guanosine2251-2'-O)-methyltransferase